MFSERKGGCRVDPGGEGGGPPPPPLMVDPKTSKIGKNVVRVQMNVARLVLNSEPDTPLSEILYPPLLGWYCYF